MTFLTFVKQIIKPKEKELSANEAYMRTKYGAYKTIAQRIKDIQNDINYKIKSKISMAGANNTIFSSYFCIIEIDDDMKDYVNEIFKPFKERGFKIITLSDKIEELHDELVFIMSWYKSELNK